MLLSPPCSVPWNLEPSCIHQSRSRVHLRLVFSCCSVDCLSLLLYCLSDPLLVPNRQVYWGLAWWWISSSYHGWQARWWCRCILKQCGSSSSDAPASAVWSRLTYIPLGIFWKRKWLRLAINHSIFVVAYFFSPRTTYARSLNGLRISVFGVGPLFVEILQSPSNASLLPPNASFLLRCQAEYHNSLESKRTHYAFRVTFLHMHSVLMLATSFQSNICK